MQTSIDIMVSGTGEFAGHIVFDIAACADRPVNVMILGRNEARLAWPRTAANARATSFNHPARFFTHTCETIDEVPVPRVLQAHRPKLVAQAADRKRTRLNPSHHCSTRMPSAACKKKK